MVCSECVVVKRRWQNHQLFVANRRSRSVWLTNCKRVLPLSWWRQLEQQAAGSRRAARSSAGRCNAGAAVAAVVVR